jgi:DNA-binding LytR/AlgR family response regulator
MIKIAICDDEEIITGQIDNIIHEICGKEDIKFDTDVFFSGNGLEHEIAKGTKYDLIYLDIQMDNGDGIATAKNIRKMDENVLLIYVSGYDKYMIELFRLNVFAFIKKPIDYFNFRKIFLEANLKICNQKFYFSFRYKNKEYKILCIDILYFESSGRTINVYFRDNKTEKFNGKLSEVEEKLEKGKIPFLRIHQSYLVNYHHIYSRSKTAVTLTNGTQLPISEDRQKNFGRQYSRLLGGDIGV